MKVSDILRVKGNTLFTVSPDQPLHEAVVTMAEHDIGSLVVMEHGDLTGMLTFREVIRATVRQGGTLGTVTIRSVMDDAPLTCTPETEIDEVRRMMLGRHARYMPVLNGQTLMGVISFYDVARTVVEAQDFENRMLKAYIRDWPSEEDTKVRPSSEPRLRSPRKMTTARPRERSGPSQPSGARSRSGRDHRHDVGVDAASRPAIHISSAAASIGRQKR